MCKRKGRPCNQLYDSDDDSNDFYSYDSNEDYTSDGESEESLFVAMRQLNINPHNFIWIAYVFMNPSTNK